MKNTTAQWVRKGIGGIPTWGTIVEVFLEWLRTTTATSVTTTGIQADIRNRHIQRGKDKIVPVLKWLCTTPLRRKGYWRYVSTVLDLRTERSG
jgi:hypothetical protein